jgi:hypothetical protein
MRRALPKDAKRGCLTGSGPTMKDAKASLERQIDVALADETVYAPQVVTVHREQALVFRYPWGYAYTMLAVKNGLVERSTGSNSYNFDVPLREVLDGVRFHLAQNAWSPDVQDDAHFVAEALLSLKRNDELLSWVRWQRKYAEAKGWGATDDQCRDHASGMRTLSPMDLAL